MGVTFQFKDEDHTFGNAVRYMLMKDPNVEFAGYAVPHPSEPIMNVRVQTHADTVTAHEAMTQAVDNVGEACVHIARTYRKAVKAYKKKQAEAQAEYLSLR